MTDARARLIGAPIVSRTAAFIAAVLLILVGLVFQLGEFIWGQLSATSHWLIHMIALNIWGTLIVRLNTLGFLRFWPLLLVGFGLAILLALEPARSNPR